MGLKVKVTKKKTRKGAAEIPEYREKISLDDEYRDFPEEKIWTPNEEVNAWVPCYVVMARSVLTFVQEKRGIPNRQALENSCSGYAEQYITDVLHESKYLPEVALKMLLTKQLPQKFKTEWTDADIELFLEGICRHGKNFPKIQKNFLCRKRTKEIVDFYYTWKWSDSAKEFRNRRGQLRRNRKWRFPSIGSTLDDHSQMRTRSISASPRPSDNESIANDDFLRDENIK